MSAASPRTFDRSIVDGPISLAVWAIAWPTVVQNLIGGLQGIVDHALVGHYVGYAANAAVGVSLQIFLVVITFVMSVYAGMGVLVARAAGANDPALVNRVVYQAFLASILLAVFVLAPVGWFASPVLLNLVNAAPAVRAEALPFLRTMFLGGISMMLFFMMSGALRAAGDAKTPLRMGILLTALNIGFNVMLIRGWGPIPALGTMGAAVGTVIAGVLVGLVGTWLLLSGRLVISWKRQTDFRPDWTIIKELFHFGLPTGLQGIAMNLAGVLLLRFIGSLPESAETQAAYAIGYTELFSLITWTSVGLMGAAAAVAGQNLGANKPDRAAEAVHVAAKMGIGIAVVVGILFLAFPEFLYGLFGIEDARVLGIGEHLLRWLSVSGLFITVALTFTGGLQGTGDTRGPLYISIVSQIVVPLGICAVVQRTVGLSAAWIWTAIVVGHMTRATLTVLRFRSGKWRNIKVRI